MEPERAAFWPIETADAALHLLQLAIPQGRVLPISLGSAEICGDLTGAACIEARENWARGGEYSFDSRILGQNGETLALIRDGRFRRIGSLDAKAVLGAAPALGEAVLERGAREALGIDGLRVAFVHDPGLDRAARREMALDRLGLAGCSAHRADGAPILKSGGGHIGLAHCECATLAIYAPEPVACDLQEAASALPPGITLDQWLTLEMASKLKCLDRSAETPINDLPIAAWIGDLGVHGLRAGIAKRKANPAAQPAGWRPLERKESGYA